MTNGWKNDDGYSGQPTKRVGCYALVVFDDEIPTNRGGSWGFQAFDEEDEHAMEYGIVAFEVEGLWSEEAAKRVAEMWAADRI